MFGFEWKGKPLIPTKKSLDEMSRHNVDMYKAKEILEEGFDCARSKRKSNIDERGVRRSGKIVKVVVADTGSYYKIIHVGEFTEKKGRFGLHSEDK
ncbi:hypothetical protein HYU20_00325 [Candidatus Woesearchaeota archaeon]|nr:hypothetical protein [Candidatus Woesearchaeota archaeon]